MVGKLYKEYFNIDPKYYAAVTAELIESGKVSWKSFYPHETFVKLLEKTYSVLSGKDSRSLWVEGAYGTGKSHAALTVKSLLEATDDEIREYFEDYKLSKDLCQKLITCKNGGKLITIHRIGSGAIRSDQDLILAVQDSIMDALAAHGIENIGALSLRDAALAWLEKEANRNYFAALISEEKYAWKFGGENIDAVIEKLKNGTREQVETTMRKVMAVAEDNGITALRMDIQGMAAWIKSIIEENHLSAILFVWDEFTEFFQNNPNSLTGFQTLTEISQSSPFYFMIVSHESKNLFIDTATAKKILDRFVPPVKIELPENMAFKLMAQAMKLSNDEALKAEWIDCRNQFDDDLANVRRAIRDSSAGHGEKLHISDEELRGILPIHPYAALMLKHLSVAFSSNQRSMFDFIINNDTDAKAFKWYIANYGPYTSQNLLTIDMLWDFFYGKGQNGLNEDVRVILDSYYMLRPEKLTLEQQRVLKTVLLLQAISLRVGDVGLLRPNEKNVDLAFSGTDWPAGKAKSIAENLVTAELLFKRPVSDGTKEYCAANTTGDGETIKRIKDELKKNTRTQELIENAELKTAIALPAAIAGRCITETASTKNFTQAVSRMMASPAPERLKVLVTFALDDEETSRIRLQIMDAFKAGRNDIIYVDAGLTPMGADLFEQYIENMAYSQYYAKNNRGNAGEYQNLAEKKLVEWRNRVAQGAFMLYTKDYPSGVRMANLTALQDELSALNHRLYPCGLEQYNVIANMFNKGPLAQGAECGIKQQLAGTFKAPNERTSLAAALSGAWGVEKYWEDPLKKNLTITKIKLKVEELIKEGFEQRSGRVSMSRIYDELTRAPFGFMPNNITAFVLGFVLKEYASGDYFWSNGSNNETLTPEKMKTMIANAINQEVSPGRNFREEYIVSMGMEQRAFLQCTAKAFGISQSACSSVESARDQMRLKMKQLSFPIWCVKYILQEKEHAVSSEVLSDIIDRYCVIANTGNGRGESESDTAAAIGKIVMENPRAAEDLARILTSENCREGMIAYIGQFDGGVLLELAAVIGDNGAYIDEVSKRFSADDANWVWNIETANDKIREVILDYRIIAESNKSLPKSTSIGEVINAWNARTSNIHIAYDAMKKYVGDLAPFLAELYALKISGSLPGRKKQGFYNLLVTQREAFDQFCKDQLSVFKQVAVNFVAGLDDSNISEICAGFLQGQFTKASPEYFQYVEERVKIYREKQFITEIREIWRDKTKTRSPRVWSSNNETPILCMIDDDERAEAKEVFRIMELSSPSKEDAEKALKYLNSATFYDKLWNLEEVDRCFMEKIVGDYGILLSNPQEIRDYLTAHTTEEPYEWMDNSAIQNLIKAYADTRYKTGGCEKAWNVIDQMDSGDLRKYLKDLIQNNMTVGIEIIKGK